MQKDNKINLLKDGNGSYARKQDFLNTWSISHFFRFLSFAHIVVNNKRNNILDIGFGDNAFVDFLEKVKYTKEYTGIDLNRAFVKNARNTNKKYDFKTEYYHTSLSEIPSSKKYDCVILGEVIEHIIQKEANAFFIDVKNKLTANGLVLLSTSNKQNDKLIWPEDHVEEFTLEQLKKICKNAGFIIKHQYGIWNNTKNTLEMLNDEEKKKYQHFAEIMPKSILNVFFNIVYPEKSRQIILILQKRAN